jgi:hypothetical protein
MGTHNGLEELVELAIQIAGCDYFADAGIHKSDESAVLSVIETVRGNAAYTGLQANALELLLAAYNGDANLCDETGDTIRVATMAEAVESGLASYEGVILINGRRCYVEG